jgi:hypothetical protein
VYVIIARESCFTGSRCKNQTDQEGERYGLEMDGLEREAMERVSLERDGLKELLFGLA